MRNPTGESGFPRAPRRSGEEGLYRVPRWEELVADPSQAGMLDVQTARIVATKALGVFMASFFRSLEGNDSRIFDDPVGQTRECRRDGTANVFRAFPDLDDIVSVEQVATILGKPRSWIIRRAGILPFVTRLSRKHYICSRIALRRWLANRPHTAKS